MKWITHKEDVRTLNVYALNTGASDLIKEKHLDVKSQVNPSTIAVDDLDTHSSRLTAYLSKTTIKKNQRFSFIDIR